MKVVKRIVEGKESGSLDETPSNASVLSILGLWKYKRFASVVRETLDMLRLPIVFSLFFAYLCFIMPLWLFVEGSLNKTVSFIACLSPIIYLVVKRIRHKIKIDSNISEAWEISSERWEKALESYVASNQSKD